MKDFILINEQNMWYGIFPQLSALGVRHAVSTRLGGCSAVFGEHDLNMSFNVGDNAEFVLDNRTKLAKAIGVDISRAVVTRQTHTNHVQSVDHIYAGRGYDSFDTGLANTDGLITSEQDLPLMLFFADCVPVIIFDAVKRVLSVVHAGWRGTVAKIPTVAVERMVAQYGSKPQDCYAFIGPSIGPCCYEVDCTVADAVTNTFDFASQVLTAKSQGKWHLDLWQTNKLALQQTGLLEQNIIVSGICTIEHNQLFFSHRQEQGKTGRICVLASL